MFKTNVSIYIYSFLVTCFNLYSNTSSSIDDHSIKVAELQWKPEKDPDFKRIVTVSLEDILRGAERTVTIKREIRDSKKQAPENEEAKYTVIIEPGCPDGKTFRFNEAGDRDPVNIPADLVVEIQTEKHPLYERSGSNLIYTKKISLQHVCTLLIINVS